MAEPTQNWGASPVLWTKLSLTKLDGLNLNMEHEHPSAMGDASALNGWEVRHGPWRFLQTCGVQHGFLPIKLIQAMPGKHIISRVGGVDDCFA